MLAASSKNKCITSADLLANTDSHISVGLVCVPFPAGAVSWLEWTHPGYDQLMGKRLCIFFKANVSQVSRLLVAGHSKSTEKTEGNMQYRGEDDKGQHLEVVIASDEQVKREKLLGFSV